MKHEKTFAFIYWEMNKKIWNKLPWYDKVRAWIFFHIILPDSKLIIKE